MALPFFYENNVTPGTTAFTLSEDTSKHCVQVLRMKAGDRLHITDGKGYLYIATIATPDKKHSAVSIKEVSFRTRTGRNITIAISLLKNTGRLEWFLEKATEIGVSSIIPLICHRTERQHFRFERMNNILIAAMLQSQQMWLPVLHEPILYEKVFASAHRQKLIAHCDDQQKQLIQQLTVPDEVLMLIGPEGDFTGEEITAALQNGFQPVSLGQNRLRTETAGVVAATLLMNL